MICSPLDMHVGLTTFLSALGMQTTFNIGGTLCGLRTWVAPDKVASGQVPPTQALQDTKGIIVLYDITNYTTFELAEEWTNRINGGLDNLPKVLVGNKCDLESKRQVRTSEAQILADGNNFQEFFEVCSRSGLNVRDVVESLVREMVWREKEFGDKTITDDEAEQITITDQVTHNDERDNGEHTNHQNKNNLSESENDDNYTTS